LHVLGCAERKTPEQVQSDFNIPGAEAPPDDAPSGTNDCGTPSNRVHQEVSQPILGEEEYQMRIVTVGRQVRQRPRELIQRLSAHGQNVGSMQSLLGSAASIGQIFVAQSEFYFDWDLRDSDFHGDYRDPKRWMWSMLWRARLRRFRLPEDRDDSGSAPAASGCADAPPASVGEACNDAEGSDAEDCGGGLDGILETIDSKIIH
jgi:hypothetical protein